MNSGLFNLPGSRSSDSGMAAKHKSELLLPGLKNQSKFCIVKTYAFGQVRGPDSQGESRIRDICKQISGQNRASSEPY